MSNPGGQVARGVQAMQAGRADEALRAFRAAVAVNPRDAEALFYGGLCALELGDLPAATDFLARARKAAPKNPDVAAAHAHAAMRVGDLENAESALRAATRLAPAEATLLCDLGAVLQQKGDLAAAESQFRKSLKAVPSHLPAAFNLALLLNLTAGGSGGANLDHRAAHARVSEARDLLADIVNARPEDLEAAFNLCVALEFLCDRDGFRALAGPLAGKLAQAASERPDDPALCVLQGRLALLLGQQRRATDLLQRAADTGRADAGAYDHLGAALYEELQFDAAAAAIETAIERGGETPERRCKFGHALLDDHKVDAARQAFEQALAMQDGYPPALSGLGLIASESGDFDAAEACYRAAITADPTSGMAWAKLAEAQRLSPTVDLPQIDDILEDPTIRAATARDMHFAAAAILDKAGDHDDAFARFRAGNDIATTLRDFDANALTAGVDAITAAFTPEMFAQHRDGGMASAVPVFVLGMPRSGTTLTEQIVASHPEVFGAGECHYLPDSAQFLKRATGTITSAAAIRVSTPTFIADAAARHLASLVALAPDAARIVDKMPANFRQLGLIPILFPNAAIIHCVRSAMDTCVSCYFQNFTQQPWSHDLHNVAAYYREYRRLMDHWHEVLPGRILDLRYEDLVADKDTHARRLVAHLGLEWTDGISDFHKTERSIKTASLWQARQPVYKTSVARWKRYEKHLGPLIEALGAYADE